MIAIKKWIWSGKYNERDIILTEIWILIFSVINKSYFISVIVEISFILIHLVFAAFSPFVLFFKRRLVCLRKKRVFSRSVCFQKWTELTTVKFCSQFFISVSLPSTRASLFTKTVKCFDNTSIHLLTFPTGFTYISFTPQ